MLHHEFPHTFLDVITLVYDQVDFLSFAYPDLEFRMDNALPRLQFSGR